MRGMRLRNGGSFMFSVRAPLAAFAACVSVFAAGQAGAVTKLVWEITSGNPALGTFQQTWTLADDGAGVVNTLNDPTILYGFVGTATASNSPITSGLLTQTHVTSYNLNSFDFTRAVDLTDDTAGSLGFSLGQAGEAKFDFGSDGKYTQAYYSVSIMGGSYGLTGVPAAAPTLADLIAYAGDTSVYFDWTEHVEASRVNAAGGYFGDVFNTFYFGRARLVSVDDGSTTVPEPSAWALMILGFGAVGAALRRRPLAA